MALLINFAGVQGVPYKLLQLLRVNILRRCLIYKVKGGYELHGY